MMCYRGCILNQITPYNKGIPPCREELSEALVDALNALRKTRAYLKSHATISTLKAHWASVSGRGGLTWSPDEASKH